MPTVDFYSKGQTDTLLASKADSSALPTSAQLVPPTSGASSGDVLTFDGSNVGWSAGGGGGKTVIATYNLNNYDTFATITTLFDDIIQNYGNSDYYMIIRNSESNTKEKVRIVLDLQNAIKQTASSTGYRIIPAYTGSIRRNYNYDVDTWWPVYIRTKIDKSAYPKLFYVIAGSSSISNVDLQSDNSNAVLYDCLIEIIQGSIDY